MKQRQGQKHSKYTLIIRFIKVHHRRPPDTGYPFPVRATHIPNRRHVRLAWQDTGLLQALVAIKAVHLEPRGQGKIDSVLAAYYVSPCPNLSWCSYLIVCLRRRNLLGHFQHCTGQCKTHQHHQRIPNPCVFCSSTSAPPNAMLTRRLLPDPRVRSASILTLGVSPAYSC